jgi:F5/8 type C domain/PKD domain
LLRHALVLLASASIAVGLVAPASVIAAPTARYTYSPANPVVGQTTRFDGSTSSCDRTPCSYRWRDDGPDGPGGANTALGTGMTLSHTFLQAGAKYVRLTVTNRRGRSNSIVKTINVAAPVPPPAPACSDSRDNDADGRTDHPADPGCESPQDGTESPDPPPTADTDRALNQPATASSHEQPPRYEPRFAIDGDPTTRWSSNYVDGQWWQVDLGGYYAVERVELNWEVAYASSYRIQVSDNGLLFTTVASPTISAAGHHVHSFAPTRARYVRVLGVTRATPWGISLFDAEVYGQPTDPPPPPTPPQCSDGVDNADPEDTLVDLADPGCAAAADDDETDPALPPPDAQVELAQPDGGPNYYGRFANPLSSSPDYFPIGAWFRPGETHQIPQYVDFGMNLFVGIEAPELVNEAAIRQAGMRSLIYIGERTRFNDLGSEVAGWLIDDEADMQHGPGSDTVGCTGSGYTVMRNAAAAAPQDGKAKFANYGKGVGWWETNAQAQCFVNNFQDLQSLDAYWMTDPNEKPPTTQAGAQRGYKPWSYGWSVDRMRFLDGMDGQRKPIWNFVETGWPWGEDPATQPHGRILPAEARAAVWHSIIAGARGILYFDHQFNGTCRQTVIRGECYTDTGDALRSTNAQIKTLAPVLNSPTVTSGVSSSAGVRAMVKWDGSNFYVFAGATQAAAQSGTVSIPCVGNATATRLGEAGSVPVTSGHLSDQFANGNAVHIYRVDGGSRCGL